MNGRIKMPLRLAAVTATAAVVCGMSAFPAAAADDDVQVVNTETVQVYTDASGKIATKRLYEQVALTGNGTVDLRNPVGTNGLRNLDGFGGFDVEDGIQTANLTVDGEKKLRTVSDYDGDLPLEVKVSYTLDGEPVEPGDVVGKSGKLEVHYTVKNVTSVQQEVTFDDGKGGTVSRNVEVPIPMVGSLTTVAPSSFTNVASSEANMAGDGKGGTKLTFTMTLFPPLGSDTVEFGYSADITDGVIPRASISALPVNPLESPSFKAAGESYEGGATTGIELTDGASQIDENLLKLRDGAADLLAGLIQLRDGARQLNDGLAGEAAPGADKLAAGSAELAGGIGQIDDGAGKLAAGATELNAGAGRLASGSGRLAAGTGEAATGSKKLSKGLRLISGGLTKLADANEGLPAAKDGATKLKAGVDLLISKLGTTDDPATIIGGLAALEVGLGDAVAGAGQISGGLSVLVGNVPSESPGLEGAKVGVDQVQTGLADAVKSGGSLDQMVGGLTALKTTFCPLVTNPADPADTSLALQCAGLAGQLLAGATDSKSKLSVANQGLIAVSSGLNKAILALEGQLIPGATELATKLGGAQAGAGKLKGGAIEFKGGMQQLGEGVTQLSDGITSAVAGVMQLSAGSQDAYSGSQDLSGGLRTSRCGRQGAQQRSRAAR